MGVNGRGVGMGGVVMLSGAQRSRSISRERPAHGEPVEPSSGGWSPGCAAAHAVGSGKRGSVVVLGEAEASLRGDPRRLAEAEPCHSTCFAGLSRFR